MPDFVFENEITVSNFVFEDGIYPLRPADRPALRKLNEGIEFLSGLDDDADLEQIYEGLLDITSSLFQDPEQGRHVLDESPRVGAGELKKIFDWMKKEIFGDMDGADAPLSDGPASPKNSRRNSKAK